MAEVPLITLNNGYQIPQVGLGVYKIGEQSDIDEAVKAALNAGYRHFDTAAFYHNEGMLAKALKNNGVNRKDVFITSKVWNADHGYDATIKAFNESLERLETDYLDMYLIHWPSPDYVPTYKAMEQLYLEGKIKAIGVSNFQLNHLRELMTKTSIRPVVNQIETNLYFQQKPLHDYLKQEGIHHESWSPLAHGNGNIYQEPVIVELAEKYQKSAAQIMLRWQIERGNIIIPKSIHQNRIEENIDLFDFKLNESDMERIALLDRDQRTSHSPDDLPWLLATTKKDY